MGDDSVRRRRAADGARWLRLRGSPSTARLTSTATWAAGGSVDGDGRGGRSRRLRGGTDTGTVAEIVVDERARCASTAGEFVDERAATYGGGRSTAVIDDSTDDERRR